MGSAFPASSLAAPPPTPSAPPAVEEPPPPPEPPREPPEWTEEVRAHRYGSLDEDRCAAELERRGARLAQQPDAPPVEFPVRLAAPLRGVEFAGLGLATPRAASPYDIADCRLVVALDDLSGILQRHGIVRVEHFSIYRPSLRAAAKPKGPKPKPGVVPSLFPRGPASAPRPAAPPRGPGKTNAKTAAPKRPPPNQHAKGLAIDIGAFVKKDGTRLDVKMDWQAAIGTPPCGAGSAPRVATAAAEELRAIVCEVRAAGLFNVMLTPNANAEHRDHFHFDLTPGARWFILR